MKGWETTYLVCPLRDVAVARSRYPTPGWLSESRPKFAYFPFGGGPRVCVGERFAWMEGVLLLAAVAQRWRFRLVPGHQVEPRPQITLRTKYGMKMTVMAR